VRSPNDETNLIKRHHFLRLAAVAPLSLVAAPLSAAPTLSPDSTVRSGSALVLGGGGARGAYQAGIIEGLRLRAGAADGERIRGIDVVCGTSIGTINAWFVATGQYSKLRELWKVIASERVFVLKRQFAATAKPGAFIVNRIVAGLSLAQGLTKNVQGILDGVGVSRWLDKYVDPKTPVLIPFVFTVTNLDRERMEIFYRLPFVATDDSKRAALARLRSTVGSDTVARYATNDLLRTAMRASAAIPVLFDPVELPSPEGGRDRYVDGGVADNDPIDVARALSLAVYTVFVDAASPERLPYRNALEIGVGAFGVAQKRVLDASLRATYLETRGKRLFASARLTPQQRAFESRILDTDLFTIRPNTELPVGFAEFDRQEKIQHAYDAGLRDIERGWVPYALPDPSLESPAS
jgi:predicted acylesterase/phospholipase RssA